MKAMTVATLGIFALTLGTGCEKKKLEEAAQSIADTAKKIGKSIATGAKKAWEATKKGATYVGEKVATGAKKAWEATKKGAKFVGEKVAAGAKFVGKKIAQGAKAIAAGTKDAMITAAIKTKVGLSKLFKVGVSTSKGTVTLTGTVKTAAEKSSIESKARATKGVLNVVNNLTVAP